MPSLWDKISWFFGDNALEGFTELPPGGIYLREYYLDKGEEDPIPDSPLLGQKRKAGDEGLHRAKTRRLSSPSTRQQPVYRRPNYEGADFYEGHSREEFRDRPARPRSIDKGKSPQYLDAGATLLEKPGLKAIGDKLHLRLVGAPMEEIGDEINAIKERIEELPVDEGEKDELRELVAEVIRVSPTTTPKQSPTKGQRRASVTAAGPVKVSPTKVSPTKTTPTKVTPTKVTPTKPSPTTRTSATGATAEMSWRNTPNAQARQILKGCGQDKNTAAARIVKSLKASSMNGKPEPLYSLRDVEIRDGLWEDNDNMDHFARKYFNFDFEKSRANEADLTAAFKQMRPETSRIIGCVASGGPAGPEGWRAFFYNKQKRRALVIAIIGNVITEQVYQHAFFGGTIEDEEELGDIQRRYQANDGFDRNRQYAKYVGKQLKHRPAPSSPRNASQQSLLMTFELPAGFHAHVQAIVEAILIHLAPITSLNPNPPSLESQIQSLYKLVVHAGILSLIMRLDPHTVYYSAPTYKEDRFDINYMECFNKQSMTTNHPLERTFWPSSWTEAEIHRSRGDEPLTQIVLMHGITAYRRGGWEDGDKSSPWKPVYEPGKETIGFRERLLSHGWVYCRWGRKRRFVNGKEVRDPKEHGMQWGGGFVEFADVEGVPKPNWPGEKKPMRV